jgi:hypothetical protein
MNASPVANGSRARSPRAERVLAALRHFGPNGIVCQTTGALAHWLDESTETVRRGIADLIAAGRLEATGLGRGKAVQYRIVESLQAVVESPQPSAQFGAPQESPSKKAPVGSSGRRSSRDSNSSDEDREWLDNFEFTPEVMAEGAALARLHADRYSSRGSSPATLRRRQTEAPEERTSRRPVANEGYFERAGRRPEIWLPAGVRR